MDRLWGELRSDLARDVKQKQADGELAEDLDHEVVASLLTAADGQQIQWLLDLDDAGMGKELELLWSGLSSSDMILGVAR